MTENESAYACGRCGASDLPFSIWKLQWAGEKASGLCVPCANALMQDGRYVMHLGTLTFIGTLTFRRKNVARVEQLQEFPAAVQKCIEALGGFGESVLPAIVDAVSIITMTFWRWELEVYLAEKGLPARLASFIAWRLPEWCLRLLPGRVIAVDAAEGGLDEDEDQAPGEEPA